MKNIFLIGIAGGSGSGKSTFSKSLAQLSKDNILLISCDNYYRANDTMTHEERKALNFDAPEALELDLLKEHLSLLKAGHSVEAPMYDFTAHTRLKETTHLTPKPIIILDGILIFSDPALRELFDLKVYVDTDADVRILRRTKRDMEERGRKFDDIMDQYIETVKPMHEKYVEPTKAFADVIINGGMNQTALDLLKAKVESILRS